MPINSGARRKRWLLGLFVVIAIFFLLFGFGSTPASANLVAPPLDKLVHVGVFATLAIGLRLCMPTLSVALIAGLALSIGLADEVHQYFVPNRQPALDDFLADVLGVFCALSLWHKSSLKQPCPESGSS